MRAAFLLVGAGLVLGYAALRYGGVAASDWNICAIALGVLLAIGYLGRDGAPAPASPLLYCAIFAIPLWAFLQTVPIPAAWVSVLSPERIALAKPLLRFGPMPGSLPLSIRPAASLQYAIRYLAFGAAFLIARDLMWRLPARPWVIALPPLAVALAESVIGFMQNAAGSNAVVSGTFVNRDHYSALLEMCLPFAAGVVFIFATKGIRAVAACAGAATAALLLAAIAVTLSRAGFAIALFSLLLLAWIHGAIRLRGVKRVLTLGGSLLAAVAAAGVLASGGLLDRIGSSVAGDRGFGDRALFWKETLQVVHAYPLAGCGFGAFSSAVTPYRQAAVIRTLDYAHNDYLQFLAEGGIIPFLFAAIVCVIVIRAALRGVLRAAPLERRGFAIACSVALLAGMLHSAVDLITYVPATGMLLCWIGGMAAGLDFDRGARRYSGAFYSETKVGIGR